MGRPRKYPTLPGETAREYELRVNRERTKRLYPPEMASARFGVWKKANPERWSAIHRKAAHKERCARYGLTPEDLIQMFEMQEGLCGICSKLMCLCNSNPRCEKRAEIDHDHNTQEVRGLLCRKCNTGIGMLRESPKILRNAAIYLESV